MKKKKINVVFCLLLAFCCPFLLSGCDGGGKANFDPDSATAIVTKLESEDDVFISAITTKYIGLSSNAKLTTTIEAMTAMNESVNSLVDNFNIYKASFSSSEYENVFSYNENGFVYGKDDDIINVEVSESALKVNTSSEGGACVIEIVKIGEANYALRYYAKEKNSELGEEILCYFSGSQGRIKTMSCIDAGTNSIIGLSDFSSFAIDDGSGYYFYT